MFPYATLTASGRLLEPVEAYLQEHMHPWHAYVHTSPSACAEQDAHANTWLQLPCTAAIPVRARDKINGGWAVLTLRIDSKD